jgi:hypothetical protein
MTESNNKNFNYKNVDLLKDILLRQEKSYLQEFLILVLRSKEN